jgi:hypothetical protein
MTKQDKPAPLEEAALEAVTGGVGHSALPPDGLDEPMPGPLQLPAGPPEDEVQTEAVRGFRIIVS